MPGRRGRSITLSGTHGVPSRQGLLWQLRPSDVEVELLAHTRRVVSRDLEEETGLHTGWIQNGGLFVASNRQRLDEYKRLMSVGVPPPGVGGCWWHGCSPSWGTAAAGLGEGALTDLGYRHSQMPLLLGHLGQVAVPRPSCL